ncbi:ATP-binding protein [Paenibacillus beijingensis]|uniref:histidine kinase n=1 Tax=Paenibacillus beijingensis TaxID=1126833 RepID=A0A0D5NFT1_9BACL|nr:ATP-binding protein [Paenibacillus beijingensis]AJY74010.1 hypothetical protein VN24_04530 [Paenibacillus beijingensis]
MWKEILLQAFISIMPVFAFQLWANRFGLRKGPLFFGLSFGLSLVLCFVLAVRLPNGLDFNMHYFPYIVGSLYGGYPVLFILSAIFIVMRIPMLDDVWETLDFIAYLAIFVPLIMLSIRPFQLARRKDKTKIAFALYGCIIVFLFISLIFYLIHFDQQLLPMLLLSAGVMALVAAMILFSLHTIESVKENYQLQTQLKRMSANYRNEVYKLQQFIDETALGVVIVDSDGFITHLNEMVLKLAGRSPYGKSKLEYMGRPFRDLFNTKETLCFSRRLEHAMVGSSTSELVEIGEKKLLQNVFAIRDAQSSYILGAAVLIYDITEISWLRDEIGKMERLSLVGQMAASITHEIRNPMAVIRGFVQLMRERSPESQQEYFRIVMDELDRANAIINDFLSLAQNRIIAKESCSLHVIMNELMPLLWADANLRGQSIELDLADDIPMLEMNDKEIKQLILNLARNGMEAMGDKGVLHLRTVNLGNGLQLRVEDEGIGISKEKMDRLFEPFFTTKTRGTGLGLPLCLSIAERHNGRIEVQSEEGKGTAFIVTFMKNGGAVPLAAAVRRA